METTDQNLEKLNARLRAMARRATDKQKPMTEVAVLLGSSILENFRKGGRPSRWKESERAKKEGGATLIDSGRLWKDASKTQVQGDKIIMGSNLKYAAIHQFGIDQEVKTKRGIRKMKMPARPYLMLQQEDILDASRILSRWLVEGV